MSDDDKGEEQTFTRAQVRQMIGAEVRKVREQFSDYDDLKKVAGEAEGSKDKLDQVLAKLEAAEKRSQKAELAVIRRDVADELGLTSRQAKRLTGATRDELLADGQEMIEDLGIKPKAKTNPPAAKQESDDEGPETDLDEQDDEQDEVPEPPARQPAPRRIARPREQLRSGAPRTNTEPEETDPGKLAALIPRR